MKLALTAIHLGQGLSNFKCPLWHIVWDANKCEADETRFCHLLQGLSDTSVTSDLPGRLALKWADRLCPDSVSKPQQHLRFLQYWLTPSIYSQTHISFFVGNFRRMTQCGNTSDVFCLIALLFLQSLHIFPGFWEHISNNNKTF